MPCDQRLNIVCSSLVISLLFLRKLYALPPEPTLAKPVAPWQEILRKLVLQSNLSYATPIALTFENLLQATEAASIAKDIASRQHELQAEIEVRRRSRLNYAAAPGMPPTRDSALTNEVGMLREEVKALKVRERQLQSQVPSCLVCCCAAPTLLAAQSQKSSVPQPFHVLLIFRNSSCRDMRHSRTRVSGVNVDSI